MKKSKGQRLLPPSLVHPQSTAGAGFEACTGHCGRSRAGEFTSNISSHSTKAKCGWPSSFQGLSSPSVPFYERPSRPTTSRPYHPPLHAVLSSELDRAANITGDTTVARALPPPSGRRGIVRFARRLAFEVTSKASILVERLPGFPRSFGHAAARNGQAAEQSNRGSHNEHRSMSASG